MENQNCLITSSTDCTVRLWTLDGHFIGTFGQPLKWDIYDSSSYQHPMAPYDVLVDPESIPEHPILQHDSSDEEEEGVVESEQDESHKVRH